ncbi:MAG: hypothetical protein AB1757_01690 [Acidobacteriota bacterium]
MAFVDQDNSGDRFVNVTHRVGKSGDWDDLLTVQLMLEFVYTNDNRLKKSKPIKGPITVTGRPARDTSILIAHYQKIVLKRAKPQGFIDRAVGKNKEKSTIWALDSHMNLLLAALRSSDTAITYLKKKAPLLASSLITVQEGLERDFPMVIATP